jgi:hypothetical protein
VAKVSQLGYEGILVANSMKYQDVLQLYVTVRHTTPTDNRQCICYI